MIIQNNILKIILITSASIGIIGLIDDKFNLNAIYKIVLLLLITSYSVFNGLNIVTLGTYDYIGNLNLGKFSYFFSICCILLLTNAFNYNDGIDGLTIITFLISSSLILLLTGSAELNYLFKFIFIILSVLLLFNYSFLNLRKIFLGDSGSLLLGFFFSLMMIYANRYLNIDAILIAWTVSYLVYEFISTNLYRILKKKKLFAGGEDHMHFWIFKKNNSTIYTSLLINLLNLCFFLIGFYSYKINELLSLLIFVLLFFLYFFLRYLLFKKMS